MSSGTVDRPHGGGWCTGGRSALRPFRRQGSTNIASCTVSGVWSKPLWKEKKTYHSKDYPSSTVKNDIKHTKDPICFCIQTSKSVHYIRGYDQWKRTKGLGRHTCQKRIYDNQSYRIKTDPDGDLDKFIVQRSQSSDRYEIRVEWVSSKESFWRLAWGTEQDDENLLISLFHSKWPTDIVAIEAITQERPCHRYWYQKPPLILLSQYLKWDRATFHSVQPPSCSLNQLWMIINSPIAIDGSVWSEVS